MQKKYSIKFLITVSLVFFLGVFTVNAQSCNSELSVYKKRDARSATINDPTKFQMELTNNSSNSQSYEIQSTVFADPCESIEKSNSRTKLSTELNVTIYSKDERSSIITVPARSTISFVAEISVAPGAKLNVWKCVELIAVSDACSKKEAKQLLKVYIPDPTQN